jgi:sulfoxide reductase catalytic subunit YedY
MLVRSSESLGSTLQSSDVTPQSAFERFQQQRRTFLTGAATLGIGAYALSRVPGLFAPSTIVHAQSLSSKPSKYTVPDNQTLFVKATNYNNFYEFGIDKSDPAKHAGTLKTRPWRSPAWSKSRKPWTSTRC